MAAKAGRAAPCEVPEAPCLERHQEAPTCGVLGHNGKGWALLRSHMSPSYYSSLLPYRVASLWRKKGSTCFVYVTLRGVSSPV